MRYDKQWLAINVIEDGKAINKFKCSSKDIFVPDKLSHLFKPNMQIILVSNELLEFIESLDGKK